MAIEHVTAVLHGLFDVDPSAKLVMLIIAEHARRGTRAVAYPSVDRIAALACLHVRQVRTIIASLEQTGWLIVERGGGRARTSLYHINLEKLAHNQRNRATSRTDNGGKNGAADCTENNTKDAADRTVKGKETVQSTPVNGAIRHTKPCSGAPETLQPTAPEPVLTGINREPVTRARGSGDGVVDNSGTGKADEKKRTEEPRSTPTDSQALLRLAGRAVKRMDESRPEKTPEEKEAERQRQLAMLAAMQRSGPH